MVTFYLLNLIGLRLNIANSSHIKERNSVVARLFTPNSKLKSPRVPHNCTKKASVRKTMRSSNIFNFHVPQITASVLKDNKPRNTEIHSIFSSITHDDKRVENSSRKEKITETSSFKKQKEGIEDVKLTKFKESVIANKKRSLKIADEKRLNYSEADKPSHNSFTDFLNVGVFSHFILTYF